MSEEKVKVDPVVDEYVVDNDPEKISDPTSGLEKMCDEKQENVDPTVDAASLSNDLAEAETEDQAEYTGSESLVELKCIRLTKKIKTLNQIMSIRKDLLDVREREAKQLIAKLKVFEEMIGNEREARTRLRERIRSAEQQCIDLTVQVHENARARREYETNLLNLSRESMEARRLLQDKSEANAVLEARVKELELTLAANMQNQTPGEVIAEISDSVTPQAQGFAVLEIPDSGSVPETPDSCPEIGTEIQDSGVSTIETTINPDTTEVNIAVEIPISAPVAASDDNPDLEPTADATENLDSETTPVEPENPESKTVTKAGEDVCVLSIRDLRDKLKLVLEKNRVLTYQMSLLNTLFMETEGTPIDFSRIKAIGDIVRESQNNPNPTLGVGTPAVAPEAEEPQQVDLGQESERRQLDVTRIMNKLDDLEGNVVPIPGEESCYTSVDTGGGPKLVLSVSRTFIKLKDLILEKKYLRQEIDGLKELNSKLEVKVDTQEKRLYRVALELNKTWSLVSKLKAQHSQLHNSEAVLRYELHGKRKLLEKLKYDLKSSRDKWARVRKQNSESQIEWQSIRDEFTRRRLEACPSRESAFSSEPLSSVSNEIEVEPEVDAGESPEKAVILSLSEDEKASATSSGVEVEDTDADAEDPLLVHDEFVEDLVEEIDDIEAAAEDVDVDDDEEVVQIDGSTASWEELVNKRALRLRMLEEQCRHLYNKVQASTARNAGLAAKLAQLHNHYGSETAPEDEAVASSSKDPADENEIGCESSTDTAYASACIGQTDDDVTEVASSDNDEDRAIPEPEEVMRPPRSRGGHDTLTQSESDLNPRIPPDERRRVSVPSTSTTQELLAELRCVLVLDEDEIDQEGMTPGPLSSTELAAATMKDMPECLDEDESESRSSPASDLNALSRILIQHLPKRLEVLKEKNEILRQRLTARDEATEHQSVVAGCSSGDAATAEDGAVGGGELMELRNELELKQKVIEELTSKIQVATENYETINREHGRMAEYFKMKMQERMIQEQRKLAKSQNAKNCSQCEKRFTLFKRKHNCSVCGHSFCTDCLVEQQPGGESGRNTNIRKQKKVRTCNSCNQRRRQLEATVIESVD